MRKLATPAHAAMRWREMEQNHRPVLALGLRLLAMVFLSLLLVLVKLAGRHGIALPEIIFWRQFFPGLLIGGWLAARRQLWRLGTRRLPIHARRAAMGIAGMVLNFGAVMLLPLAQATVLGFTAPIFAVVLAATVLREHVGPFRWFAVALDFAGVLVVAGPGGGDTIPLDGLAVGVGAAFMVALISIQLRDLGRTEEPLRIVFWFSAISVPVLALALPLTGVRHDAAGWALLLGIGILGSAAQLCLTSALRFGPVSSVIAMDYTAFGWATLWGWLVFGNLPPVATFIGAPAIVVAGLVIVWREGRTPRGARVSPAAEPGLPVRRS
ncbi:DMT family transporter [Novosphingobium sp. ZN18A2]|uniref:DMT family transporter n=1 Tax=Novosphingobium sp. ZN18A2 TaxID=3079861 RepID=UPI0030CECF8A